ncbi:hypothetical protein L208DRAFT_905076 [Tricholoma matsutake]|nr:hypothetical protein L208DRAFT_905076 [Tricholoma matsutake 945]
MSHLPPPYGIQTPINPERRPLPEGWISQFDNNYKAWFYVNTRAQPPVTQWAHPGVAPPPPSQYAPPPMPPTHSYPGESRSQNPYGPSSGYNPNPYGNQSEYGGHSAHGGYSAAPHGYGGQPHGGHAYGQPHGGHAYGSPPHRHGSHSPPYRHGSHSPPYRHESPRYGHQQQVHYQEPKKKKGMGVVLGEALSGDDGGWGGDGGGDFGGDF